MTDKLNQLLDNSKEQIKEYLGDLLFNFYQKDIQITSYDINNLEIKQETFNGLVVSCDFIITSKCLTNLTTLKNICFIVSDNFSEIEFMNLTVN